MSNNISITAFNKPAAPPIEMLTGYRAGYEKETTLGQILITCIENQDLACAVTTKYEHPTMVEDGLLEKVGDYQYRLTAKAIELLYSVYGKKE